MRLTEVLGLALLIGLTGGLFGEPPPSGKGQPFDPIGQLRPPALGEPTTPRSTEVRDAIAAFGRSETVAPSLLPGGPSLPFSSTPASRGDPWPARPANGVSGGESRVVARVNGVAIHEAELLAISYQACSSAFSGEQRRQILQNRLNELIERELVLQLAGGMVRICGKERYLRKLKHAAAKEFEKKWLEPMMQANRYTDPSAFAQFLRTNGLAVEQVRRAWIRNQITAWFLADFLKPEMDKVDDRQVSRYYHSHREEFHVAACVTWQDLIIVAAKHPSRQAARAVAEGLRKRIDAGEDFERLSRRYDDGITSLRTRSEGVGQRHGEIRPAGAEAVLFHLKEGQTAVVETDPGFHVVKLLSRQEEHTKSLAEAAPEIKEKLRVAVFRRDLQRLVESLRKLMVVENLLQQPDEKADALVAEH